jgi:hypothetical protein
VTIVLVHSLGGFVVKQVQRRHETSDQKTLIEGYNNPNYASLYRDIVAVMLLGTPYQGSDLARILDLILNTSFSSRNFIKQLHPNSDALDAINNNFRHQVEHLKLISFFETENTHLQKVNPFKVFSFILLVDSNRENDCSQKVCETRLL